MAEESVDESGQEPQHRGRIQAQGGGTEKSESWAQATAPTEKEMLEKCDQLERQLTEREQKDREKPLEELRRFICSAARAGGANAPKSKSFTKRGMREIRVDIEIITGKACVPDPESR